jgi:hypothetical protein
LRPRVRWAQQRLRRRLVSGGETCNPNRLVSGGETGDDAVEKQKGTYLLDLDGVKHFTRNKADLALIEREHHFSFGAMDTRRRDFATSTDYIIQTETYRSMINEQGDTPTGDKLSSPTLY